MMNHNPHWYYIPDTRYKILITGGSGSDKTDMLLTLMKLQWPGIGKIYLYIHDPSYQSISYLSMEEKM